MFDGRIQYTEGTLEEARLLAVRGDLDLSNSAAFGDRLAQVADGGDRKLVLDISEVEFVDSTVIHALFANAPRIRAAGGDMAIVVGDTHAARVLRMSGVDVLYRVVHSREEALERLRGVTRARPA